MGVSQAGIPPPTIERGFDVSEKAKRHRARLAERAGKILRQAASKELLPAMQEVLPKGRVQRLLAFVQRMLRYVVAALARRNGGER
jgi:hypothetical protein